MDTLCNAHSKYQNKKTTPRNLKRTKNEWQPFVAKQHHETHKTCHQLHCIPFIWTALHHHPAPVDHSALRRPAILRVLFIPRLSDPGGTTESKPRYGPASAAGSGGSAGAGPTQWSSLLPFIRRGRPKQRAIYYMACGEE